MLRLNEFVVVVDVDVRQYCSRLHDDWRDAAPAGWVLRKGGAALSRLRYQWRHQLQLPRQ